MTCITRCYKIFCEIIVSRFQVKSNRNGFNPRKCNSASSLSGCIERDMSKIIIALPANKTVMEIFEKALTGGFSCVNTSLGFDTEILMSNYTAAEYDKVITDKIFKSYKHKDIKVA